jgi:resolvase, N domain protein
MIYGYARVSSKEQSLERQIKILKDNGVPAENIYTEFASGKDFKSRIEYKRLLEVCAVGDVIVFTALDRFSRNINGAIKELETLEKRGIKAKFIKESITTEMQGVAKLIISVFMYVAEQERELIKERQKQGYNALKKNNKGKMISNRTGEVIGRKGKILTAEQIKLLKEFKAGKSAFNISQLARMLEVSRPFIYKKLSEL